MQKFSHGDLIKIKGRKHMHFGKVGTLRHAYGESSFYSKNWPVYADFLAEMFRRQDGDKYLAYANQRALVISADPSFYTREKAKQDASREVVDGEIVEIDGEQMRVKFVGDYSDMIKFYPVE